MGWQPTGHFVWLHELCFLTLLSLCSSFNLGLGFLTYTLRRGPEAWKRQSSGLVEHPKSTTWSTVVVHSQMQVFNHRSVQKRVNESIDSNTIELSPRGHMAKTALCRLRRVSTEILRTHICPPLSGRRSLPTKMHRWTLAWTTEGHTAIAVHGRNICPLGFSKLNIFPRFVKKGESLHFPQGDRHITLWRSSRNFVVQAGEFTLLTEEVYSLPSPSLFKTSSS